MKIFSSCRIGNRKHTHFEKEVAIADEDAFFYDHMMAQWIIPGVQETGSIRSRGSVFQESNFLYFDVDNTHSDASKDWMTIDGFLERFSEYSAIVYTSRNHMRDKIYPETIVAARPRFHVLFPLPAPLTVESEFANYLSVLSRLDPAFDKNTDSKRFYYGHPGTQVVVSKGTGSILEYLEPIVADHENSHSKARTESKETDSDDELIQRLQECAEKGQFDDYSAWIALGMALYSAGHPVEVWHSLSWEGVTLRECQYRWGSFNGNQVTRGTLYYFVRQIDPGFGQTGPLNGESKLERILRYVNRR